jgi:uroporphyrinogen-III synthase
MPPQDFSGLRVLSLESRRASEMAKLISNYGGQPTVVPSMKEVPLASNTEALAFIRALLEGQRRGDADGTSQGNFDAVILLTGVGTRMLARLAETICPLQEFVAALSQVAVVARGPKPVAVLKELGVPVTLAVPEPNTWRDLLRTLDLNSNLLHLQRSRVAVQEYGVSNSELLIGLVERGALITRVPVYEWALPDDIGPLREVIRSVAAAKIDLALFTTSMQVVHMLRIAAEMDMETALRGAFSRIVVGSIGPVTSQTLREHGLRVDFEPEHPKMGALVSEAARLGPELARHKQASSS